MNKVKTLLVSTMMMLGLVAVPALAGPAAYATSHGAPAANNKTSACNGVTQIGGGGCNNNQFNNFIKDIINILLFLIGAIAVVMIIIGGLRYVTSGGDQGAITGAKNTILYAVIGLVIAVMAFAIVNFVLGALTPNVP